MVASPCLVDPVIVIKYPMDMVCSEWGSRPHAFGLDGGQASHYNVVAVSAKPAVWPWVFVNVLLGCFR